MHSITSPTLRIGNPGGFFLSYTYLFAIVVTIWWVDHVSYLMFALSLAALLFFPLFRQKPNLFEPITLYSALFAFPFFLKPLINYFFADAGEERLVLIGGMELYYEKGQAIAFLLFLIHVYLVNVIYFYLGGTRSRVFLGDGASHHGAPGHEYGKLRRDRNIWKLLLKLMVPVYGVAIGYFFVVVMKMNYAEYALTRNEILVGQGLPWLLAQLGVPLAVICLYLLFQNSNRNDKMAYGATILFCVATNQLVSPGRGGLLIILFAAFMLYSWKVRPIGVQILLLAFLGSILFSFAILYYREISDEPFNLTTLFYFLYQDLSVFDHAIIAFGKNWLNEIQLSLGGELVSTLLFVIPRSIWATKPLLLGSLEIQDALGVVPVEVSQVSVSSFAEGIYNFGIAGVLISTVVWGMSLRWLRRLVGNGKSDIGGVVYAMLTPLVVLAYLKNGFSMIFIFLILSPIWVVLGMFLLLKRWALLSAWRREIIR